MSSDKTKQDDQKPVLAGSVFVNNTTYAGCDIKVLINIYDGGGFAREEEAAFQDRLETDSKQLTALKKEIKKEELALSKTKSFTPEYENIWETIEQMRTHRDALQESVESSTASLAEKFKPAISTKVLAECQTLSLSVFRDKQAVRSFGTVYPRGFCRGPREIAGSLVFTVFDEHVLYEFLTAHASDFDAVAFTSAVLDQIPPVDILVSFANEYGSVSRMTIYGVEFIQEGQTMSIEDLITENVVSFVARDYDPMRSVSQRDVDIHNKFRDTISPKRASDLILEDDYQDVKSYLSPFTRMKRRRNPFI